MALTDKLRILWIDDCQGLTSADGRSKEKYQFPEPDLPVEYRDDFEIVRPPTVIPPSSVRNAEEMSQLLTAFLDERETDFLPAEIVAMDYVLRQAEPGRSIPAREPNRQAQIAAVVMQDDGDCDTLDDVAGTDQAASRSFEGLLIGVFYASLVSDHPTAVVPMTNYGHVMENTRDVLALHTISQGLLNINYSEFGVSGKDRSWHKILPTGVEAFRKRIELLAKSGKVVPTFRSLRELASQTGSTLEIDTRYGHRCWSISALFVDEPQPDRRGMKAESWALKRIEELATDRSNDDEDTSVGTAILHDWARALDLARDLWTKYTNRELMKMRQRVSRIAWQLQAGERTADSLSNEDNDALSHFGVVSSSLVSTSECRSEDCVDILSGDYSTRQRRWAALIIVVRVIHRRWEACGRIQDSIATLTEEETDREERDHYQQMLARAKRLVNDEDIYLALFPIPTKPLILPWDRKPPPTISSQPRFKEVARKMRLSIENVLKSRLHHADAMDEEGSGGFGMDLGELRVMRSYASEWYLEQSSKKKTGLRDWVADDQMKEVLLWDDPSIVREFVHE